MTYKKFLDTFKPEVRNSTLIDVDSASSFIKKELGVPVPEELINFWTKCGAGYFGERDIYFFGTSECSPRNTIADWNLQDFWRDVYPSPKDGGPVFFAENSFGEQIGFRWENGICIVLIFIVDTFESFVLCQGIDELFNNILTDKYALVEPERLDRVVAELGELPEGKHYAPILSPMLGGTGDVSNFAIETPNVHYRTAISTFLELKSNS